MGKKFVRARTTLEFKIIAFERKTEERIKIAHDAKYALFRFATKR